MTTRHFLFAAIALAAMGMWSSTRLFFVDDDLERMRSFQMEQRVATEAVGEEETPGHEKSSQMKCLPLSQLQQDQLRKEIKAYERSKKFRFKVREIREQVPMVQTHVSIRKYLENNVLDPGWSVLELGCAAGIMLKVVHEWFETNNHPYGDMVGLELVTGWVKSAQEYFNGNEKPIHVFEGDMTEFSLPSPYTSKTFDFVMLNDVLEHLDTNRYGCFFNQLKAVTHEGSIVYAHTPTPEAQLAETDQYFENVLPHDLVVTGMKQVGFEIVTIEHDVDTSCSFKENELKKLPRALRESRCLFGGWTKYTHSVFQRAKDKRVFALH